jgi:Holliday junction resolvase RusA-like endonuclease
MEESSTGRDHILIRMEPATAGPGKNVAQRKDKLRIAFREQVSRSVLERIKQTLSGQLVRISVTFLLWKSSPEFTNTRPVKDLDNLLKILLDVIGSSNGGLGLVKEDSYICQINAKKELVDDEKDEGYKISFEPYNDDEMLKVLENYLSNTKSS